MPDAQLLITLAVTIGGVLVLFLGLMALYAKTYVRVDQHQALIVNALANVRVFFTGALVLPFVQKAEVIDMSIRQLTIERRGDCAILLADGSRAELIADVYVRVNRTPEDVLRAAQTFGAPRVGDDQTLASLLVPKLESTLEMVCIQTEFDELFLGREALEERLSKALEAEDLDGLVIDDITLRVFNRTWAEKTA